MENKTNNLDTQTVNTEQKTICQSESQTMKAENKVFIGLLMVMSLAFLWLMSPFYGAILCAVAIAIIFFPLKIAIIRRLKMGNLMATLLTLLSCCVVVIIPMTILVSLTVKEAQELVEKVNKDEINTDQYIEQISAALPINGAKSKYINVDVETLKKEAKEGIKTLGKIISQKTWLAGISTLGFILNIGVMLYLAFFLLKEGKTITETLFRALPLGDKREVMLFEKFKEVTRATVKGNIIVASLQGLLGGLTFWALAIPGAALWMFIMAIAAMIPVVGAAIVWGPAMIYFFATGDYAKACILLFVGVFVIGLVDNILRPLLVGRDTKLPDYIIFISTIGGIAMFGINGFVIGPMIAAMFFVCWSIFIEEF